MTAGTYTSKLGAGLGLIDETRTLLELWQPGMTSQQLHNVSLEEGSFPNIAARRLRNIIIECFAPRYLVEDGAPAKHLKALSDSISKAGLTQLMFMFTCRANPILSDFVRDIYWARYAGGYSEISNADAKQFVERAIDDEKTSKHWSEKTVQNVAGYLTGCCADYGLLERGQKVKRNIQPFHMSPVVAAYLSYEQHFKGAGDNAILNHQDWQLFGMDRDDVLEELKRLSLKGLVIIQAAGDVVRISWKQSNMEELCDVLTTG
jgi:hypothetical protein